MRPLSLKVDSKRLPVTTQGEYLQYAESVRNNTSDHVRTLIVVPLFLETYQHVDHAHTMTTVVVLCGIASPLRVCTEVVPRQPLLLLSISCLLVPFSDNVLYISLYTVK